jgi:uncharacterized integral membrane protein|uniref:lipopolysaccharide assembly protein LapA domain-containing protein n=1 Tax=Cephaloticoccus sp. TaxID=1985742 RepID=UPI00404A851C
MNWRTLSTLLLLILLGIFALQNTAVLTVSFLFWSFKISQALLIALCGMTGLLIGLLFNVTLKVRRRHKS